MLIEIKYIFFPGPDSNCQALPQEAHRNPRPRPDLPVPGNPRQRQPRFEGPWVHLLAPPIDRPRRRERRRLGRKTPDQVGRKISVSFFL